VRSSFGSYRGSVGANFLLRLRRGDFIPESQDAAFYQDALLIDFVPRKDLRKEERAIIQQIDSNHRSANPGFSPSFKATNPDTCRGLLMRLKAVSCLMICEKPCHCRTAANQPHTL